MSPLSSPPRSSSPSVASAPASGMLATIKRLPPPVVLFLAGLFSLASVATYFAIAVGRDGAQISNPDVVDWNKLLEG